ncbi:hypothetical protein AALO_G00215340 [Alosa alosa]|uniref:Uncharacterized protein n=1 Tax=Alosa alosa TaxID=278164 RepID=A0AAV6G5C6_9TELE|nr:hypothetical protein AALO_G00215340 [Alosa alosa]
MAQFCKVTVGPLHVEEPRAGQLFSLKPAGRRETVSFWTLPVNPGHTDQRPACTPLDEGGYPCIHV